MTSRVYKESKYGDFWFHADFNVILIQIKTHIQLGHVFGLQPEMCHKLYRQHSVYRLCVMWHELLCKHWNSRQQCKNIVHGIKRAGNYIIRAYKVSFGQWDIVWMTDLSIQCYETFIFCHLLLRYDTVHHIGCDYWHSHNVIEHKTVISVAILTFTVCACNVK